MEFIKEYAGAAIFVAVVIALILSTVRSKIKDGSYRCRG